MQEQNILELQNNHLRLYSARGSTSLNEFPTVAIATYIHLYSLNC